MWPNRMASLNVYGSPVVDPNNQGIGAVVDGVAWALNVIAIIVVGLRYTPDD